MAVVTFDALLRGLKQGGTPAAVYYLHGDEDVLKDEAVRALVDRMLDPGARDFNFDQRSAADLDPEAFHSLVNTPPLLAAARVVVLRGIEDVRKTSKVRQELLRYLESPSPTTLLILVQGAGQPPDAELARSASAVAVEPLPHARVLKWVAHRAGQLKLAFEPDAVALLGQLRAARPYGLGSWEQTASRWARWGAGWDAGALRKALRLALDADRALKSTTLTHEPGILVQLVLSFGALQQEAA